MSLKKILLAEDDLDDRNLFCEYMNVRNDIAVLSIAENGIELIEYLDKMPEGDLPDLIILDQNMPKKNGLQTLEHLKSTQAFSHIPVIIYSTYADDLLRKRCIAKGASLVASKPLTNAGYQEMMDEFLQSISR